LIINWKLNEIVPFEIELKTVTKFIDYGFALDYWGFIIFIIIWIFKIFFDIYHYDEETKLVDYYLELKETFIYKYKSYLEVFDVFAWFILGLTLTLKFMLKSNPFYINDIFFNIIYNCLCYKVYIIYD